MSETSLLWLRRDLRLHDHPALVAAAAAGAVVPVFIWAPEEDGAWKPGAASRWWLHASLESLQRSLVARGSRLILRRGPSLPALAALARETGATAVHWSRLPEPPAAARDEEVAEALRALSLEVSVHEAARLFAPGTVRTADGRPFSVFTPFWRACLAAPPPPLPLPAPRRIPAPTRWPASLPVDAFGLDPRHPWSAKLARAWEPGEASAQARLRTLVGERLRGYDDDRNRPDLEGTSSLSPHLHHGEIGPRQIWHALADRHGEGPAAFLRELGWREFAHDVLEREPTLPDEPHRPEFRRFGWEPDAKLLRAWQRGRTGYPLVDAGMRQLWETGWMHNRVRMVVASFLIKHLLIPWQEGERWFWDTLVDADLANNSVNWQWVAGSGLDPAPFFRIFNPVAQSERFDPQGHYIRRWVPELAKVPPSRIHQPWDAVTAGYPARVVEHAPARRRALAKFAELAR